MTTAPEADTRVRVTTERTIDLEIAHNVRHLGGHPTAGGQETGASDLFRGGSLHELTARGQKMLRDLGVRVVVDFRSETEQENSPTPALERLGIEVVAAPVFTSDASPTALAQRDNYPGHAALYRQFLAGGGSAYRTLFETIAHTEGGVLFHCAAGKDRTGVAAAILLELAGVPDAAIAADYARSTKELEPFLEQRMMRFEEYGISPETGRKMMSAPPVEMEATLDFIRGRWGSAAGYLGAMGVDAATVAAVRARMLRTNGSVR